MPRATWKGSIAFGHFKTAVLEKTKTIANLDFVDPAEVDDRYYETPYDLLPGKEADRAYGPPDESCRTCTWHVSYCPHVP